ncbi:MAG: ArsR/SmtB family transcription factor [Longimicrobiales bacterium]
MAISESGNNQPRGIGGAFAALADPVRLQILERLLESDATVSELATDLNVGMPSMSKHLTVLQRAGFVARRAEAQRRHCSLDPEAFLALLSWASHFEAVWTGRLSRLDAILQADGGE